MPKIFPALDPLIKSFFSPFLPSDSVVSEMTLREENREFRKQLSQSQFDQQELIRLQEEVNGLRAQLDLKGKLPYKTKVFPIYERHPIVWNYEFSVRADQARLLRANHGVLIGGYLAGRAKLENKNSLRIRTFLNHDEELAVNVKGSSWNGLLKGEYQERSKKTGRLICLVDYLPRDADIKPGMFLQSTGTLGIPKGILVAKVIETEKDEVVQRAIVELLAPIKEAEYISLISEGE
ncbi:rod shape-determining protein MreC [Lentisphaera profundi]|uniref:Cell shape-determining protein MreC n=1 Tax=Lentisphaera profundi TaxID=1658616 RepID=A0ABY7VTR5_9BACT|nr:rod shape-determining protein MreC [Lentisphaera profundi]WDE96704.1 rod shape-determining protein MreC [Lentisphaera profundi]